MTRTEKHTLKFDTERSPALGHGKAQERHWYCTCGHRYFGYDSTVRREHTAHRREASA